MAPQNWVKPIRYAHLLVLQRSFSITVLILKRIWCDYCDLIRNAYNNSKMKGDNARRKGRFKRGNKYSKGSEKGTLGGATAPYVRPTEEEVELLKSDPIIDAAMGMKPTHRDVKPTVKVLRPTGRQSYCPSKKAITAPKVK